MANPNRAYAQNIPGNFFVDDTCIDCDLCRQIAPSVFKEDDDHSVVHHQPESPAETHRSTMALVACPTGSIGTRTKVDSRAAAASFPELIDENVHFCGYASPNSYGASSYLITRPEGNVLIDSPRFARTLVRRIEGMGGVSLMFFSHRDDVADHEKFHEHFGCRRVIHRADSRGIETEQLLEGDEPVTLDKDLLAIPVPGHTKGHVVLLYRNKFLFTGDHLAWGDRPIAYQGGSTDNGPAGGPGGNRPDGGGLIAFRRVAWYSWREQTTSMKRLLDFRFEWVLPGHGRRAHQPQDTMHQSLIDCIKWMERTK
jgi:glyoxylase-like metal-dependent hydrolase (beta-lactamase superfamily II)/ferredoxin